MGVLFFLLCCFSACSIIRREPYFLSSLASGLGFSWKRLSCDQGLSEGYVALGLLLWYVICNGPLMSCDPGGMLQLHIEQVYHVCLRDGHVAEMQFKLSHRFTDSDWCVRTCTAAFVLL